MNLQQLSMVDPEGLRTIMRQWASGVTIVTAMHEGQSHGMTVSSFTSISLTPPSVLIALERGVRTHSLVTASGSFGVSVLAENQQALSELFAQRNIPDLEHIEQIDLFFLKTGSPLLRESIANLDCRVSTRYEVGTHTVFLGEVVDYFIGKPQSPLLYFDRSYATIKNMTGGEK